METSFSVPFSSSHRQAYRLASIGLVGNLPFSARMRAARVAYRLASIGFGGNLKLAPQSSVVCSAYRLVSIGLVGNFCSELFFRALLISRLPIGFDRISWKYTKKELVFNQSYVYRLASIGLVGNVHCPALAHTISTRLTDWLRSDWLKTLYETTVSQRPSELLTDWLRSDWLETRFHRYH